jgi:hypothetical protein
MNEPIERDHQGIWMIRPPKDMPLVQIAMLQETIKDAWATYGGDPNNGEQFWNHLVGNGMANVPRETPPPANAHDALLALMRKEIQPSQEEWDAHMQEIRRRAGVTDVPRETPSDDGVCHDETMIEHFEKCVPGGKAALDKARSELVGAEMVAKRQRNVPRETSEGEA